MIRSVRFRITAWYLLFFSVLMALFSVFLYGMLARAVRNRLDETLWTEANTAASLFHSELEELKGDVRAAAAETIAEMRVREVRLAIFDGQEQLAATRPESAGMRAVETSTEWAGRSYRVLAMASLDSVAAELRTARQVLLLTLPVLLLIAAAGGFALARAGLRPLASMAEQAGVIGGRTLHKRIEVGSAGEELQVLAASFNELLARLDASFETMRRFMADASHELRTPVAVIRGEAEVALGRERSPREYREALAIIQDEAGRLTRLVDDLLNLARADAGSARLQTAEFYFNDLLAECCRSMQTMAAASGVSLECRCPDDVTFRGDEPLLRRMLLNLLDNAIRYTPAGGKVDAALEPGENELRLTVADTGIGIAPEAAPHIFERFYRADGARSRHEGGFGLGLAIVKWVAESHGGLVELSSTPGAGSTFTVRLPR